MKRLLVLISVLHCLSMSTAAAQATSHDFYKGKAVRIVVGNSVGGAMDDWARFIALYLGKHIPGNSGHFGAEHARRGEHHRRQSRLQRRQT